MSNKYTGNKMLPFFPSPYPDELLYSVIARYHAWSGNTGFATTINDIFNKRTPPIVELPTMLARICEKSPEGTRVNPEYIINNLTLYPLYRPFLSVERDSKITESMVATNDGRVSPQKYLGLYRTYKTPLNYLRYCPKCYEEDERLKGEAYWHRSHQAFGVYICPHHRMPLLNYSEPLEGFKLLCLSKPSGLVPIKNNKNSKENELYEAVSGSVYWLLSNPKEVFGLDNLRDNYNYYLAEKNFIMSRNFTKVKFRKLAEEVYNFYGPDFLKIMGCYFEPEEQESKNWLGLMLSNRLLINHPIRHILLTKFLGINLKDFLGDKRKIEGPFGAGPWPCLNPAVSHYGEKVISECKIHNRVGTNLPVGVFKCKCGFAYSRLGPDSNGSDKYVLENIVSYGSEWEKELLRLAVKEKIPRSAISCKLKVPVYIINRRLRNLLCEKRDTNVSAWMKNMDLTREHKRKEWLSIINNNHGVNRTNLRNMARNTYYWLNKYDKEWFLNHCPRPVPKKQPSNRIDWNKRDQDMAEKVREVAEQIRNKDGKPIRVSSEEVFRELGENKIHGAAWERMPLTHATLNNLTESFIEFDLRRVRWAINAIQEKNISPTKWRIFEITGGKRIRIFKTIEENYKEFF